MITTDDGLEHFQMVPDSVLFDPELTGQDVRVFAFLAFLYRGTPRIGRVSHRKVASMLSISKATAWVSLKRLESRGHIISEYGNMAESVYYICSNRFTKLRGTNEQQSKG